MTVDHGLTRYKRGPDENGNPGRGCRCFPCRKANNDNETRRKQMIDRGLWQPFVPAGRARDHIRWLSGQGIGWRQAAKLAGVSQGCVNGILYARSKRQPSKRIRRETETAILAVHPGRAFNQLDDLTPVDPTGTRRRAQAMAAVGWSFVIQAARAGVPDLNEALGRDRVQAGTARKIRVLYDELCGRRPVLPAETTRWQRSAVTRTRKLAAARGWAPPGAWDDSPGPHCIDDPAARPVPGSERDRRRDGIVTEEAAELAGHGEHPEMIPARLGVSQRTVNQSLERTRAKNRAQGEAA